MAFSHKLMVLVVAATAVAASSAMAADPAPAPAAACPAPDNKDAVAFIKNPKWVSHPSSDDVNKAFPPFEMKQHKSDRTVVDCAIADDGSLKDCTVVEDKRPHAGFDKATLSLTKFYKMDPLASQPAFTGLPECIRKLGAPHVVIPMDWNGGG